MTGFGRLLRAEWTKFRTVRGWVLGTLVAVALLFALGSAPGMQGSCRSGDAGGCGLPTGPGGEEVTDVFTFVHRPLEGDGTLTARVAALTGDLPEQARQEGSRAGVVPWAKAGLLIKDGTRPGSTYAGVMLTGGHGVRMQHDFVHDLAGRAGGGAPRWLRLTRRGDVVTGEESADGARWALVARVRLPRLPATAQAGLFVASPQFSKTDGVAGAFGGPTTATAAFDRIDAQGGWAGGWTEGTVGARDPIQPVGAERTAEGYELTGSGDIAPAATGASGLGTTITQTLVGTFAALLVVVVIGALSATSEYRRGLIRTTFAAGPVRGRVLAAKALVVGGVMLVAGTVAAAVVVTVGRSVLESRGVYVHAAPAGTQLRLIAGTGALLALSAVLALTLGTLLRRGPAAVMLAVALTVLPYLLAVSVLPLAAGAWLLRVTPAAAFAVQQSGRRWPQVDDVYTPAGGFFPLPPWAGLGVLAGWAALALVLAVHVQRRRDA